MNYDSDFVLKLKKGNKRCFESLFLDTYESLCEYSASILTSKELAEHAVQDVFESLWQLRKNLDPDMKVKPYLFQSVRNRSLDIVMKEGLKQKYQKEVLAMYNENLNSSINDETNSTLIRRVHEEIQNLPEKNREVYLLHRRDGLTYVEIAEVLGLSVKAVEARMSKALKILRMRLDKEKNNHHLLPLLAIFTF